MQKISNTIKLHNGSDMPRLGLGVWGMDDNKTKEVVIKAIKNGYRLIDTARMYNNERGVGLGILQSGIKRDEIFITTKLAIFDLYKPEKAFYESLERLNMDYIDLYLIHWPFLGWKNAWKTLEKIYKNGKAKAIGVSNFNIEQLKDIKNMGYETPIVNQIELSPFLYRKDLIDYCESENITIEAYSPLTRGKRLGDRLIEELAKKYKRSSAQIMLRWGLQHNFVIIPKTENELHLKENLDIFDFEIDKLDMKKLDNLNENYSALMPGWVRR